MRVLAKSRNVLIRPESYEKKVGGIIIPDTVQNRKERWGEIVSVGDYKDPSLVAGMRVFYRIAGAVQVEDNGDQLQFVPYDNILGCE